MPTSTRQVYEFGAFRLDPAERILLRQGEQIALTPKVFDTLVLLVEKSGRLITKGEFMKQVWAETFVEEATLAQSVSQLRKALGDPGMIETVPKKGYRFLGSVRPLGSGSASANGGAINSQSLPLATADPEQPAIVVLPFANLSGDPDSEFFADGITEEIINALAQIKNLRVVARTSAFSFKGKQVDVRTLGAALSVGSVLEGSVRRSGDCVRIVAQLINVADGFHIWSERYDRKLQNVFGVQDEIARTIAERLEVSLEPELQQKLASAGTRDLSAYQLYLRGRFHWNKRSLDGLPKAVECFQQAIAIDPNYAVAYAGLADAYNMLSFRNILPPNDVMPKAKAAAAKALKLDPNRAEPHVSLGYATFTYDRDWPAAGRHFEQALALNRAYVLNHSHYALYLTSRGRFHEALAIGKRALELDPAAPAVSNILGVLLYSARFFDQAIQQCQQTLEMDPNYHFAYVMLAQVYSVAGLYRDTMLTLEKALAIRRSPWELALLGYTHARLGDRTAALEIVAELERTKSAFVSTLCFALIFAGLNELDEAFAWLEKARAERPNRLAYIKVEPLWDPLRTDPRFTEFLRPFNIPP